MGNKQGQPSFDEKLWQKKAISDEVFLLQPVDQQKYSAVQLLSKSTFLTAESYLKSLRHPNILKHIQSFTIDSKLIIVVEKSSILDLSTMSDEEICFGIHSLLSLLQFLHSEVKLCGIDLSGQSIFVDTAGTWKIGLFHTARKISSTRDLLSDFEKLAKLTAVALKTSSLPNTDDLIGWLDDLVMSGGTPPDIADIKNHPYFQDPFLETVLFLDNFLLKSADEKSQFFQKLDITLRSIPEDVVAKRLTNKLLSRHVVLDETAQVVFLPKYLTPAPIQGGDSSWPQDGILCQRLFKDFVVPEIIRIFHVREMEVRLVFLRNFPRYFRFIEKPVFEEDILAEIMLGIRDSNDAIVAETLRALSELVPVLGANVVMGPHRLKIFADGRPKTHLEEPMSRRFSPVCNSAHTTVPENPRLSTSQDNQSLQVGQARSNSLSERIPPEGGEDNCKIASGPVRSLPLVNGSEIAESIKAKLPLGETHQSFDEISAEWTSWDADRDLSPEPTLNKNSGEWLAWEQSAESMSPSLDSYEPLDQMTLGESSPVPVIQDVKVERKTGGKPLSLRPSGWKSLPSPKLVSEEKSESLNGTVSRDDRISLGSNGVSLSRKTLQGKINSAKKTGDPIGSEFDIMAVDLKIKKEESAEDKLFEEFFGSGFSSHKSVAFEEPNPLIDAVHIAEKSKFIPDDVDQGESSWSPDDSGWDEF